MSRPGCASWPEAAGLEAGGSHSAQLLPLVFLGGSVPERRSKNPADYRLTLPPLTAKRLGPVELFGLSLGWIPPHEEDL